ncbi:DNA-binding protein [Fulvimarina endophytica]|uniref:DNA-binding protein n=1 Tax=Fulvimarina endophytica TaxID=2293836 RepID=A0A371X771_9HYPH|nr:helix-turn-helix domain-containing protein [Fulvimarina endophytica]RFC65056.1 DNA-binding protein [Fulvimarina endophytica]
MSNAVNRTEKVDLAALMTVDQAVERFQIFKRDKLLDAIRKGELRHCRVGRGRLVTEQWLEDYVRRQLHGGDSEPWQDEEDRATDASRSQASGSGSTSKADGGSAIGMTREEEESAANLLAQAISRKPKRN